MAGDANEFQSARKDASNIGVPQPSNLWEETDEEDEDAAGAFN